MTAHIHVVIEGTLAEIKAFRILKYITREDVYKRQGGYMYTLSYSNESY